MIKAAGGERFSAHPTGSASTASCCARSSVRGTWAARSRSCFIDLDRFKRINGVFGLDAGNRVLREAAARIRKCVREDDGVSRVGSDEFRRPLEGIEIPSLTSSIAERIPHRVHPTVRDRAARSVHFRERRGRALSRDGESAEDLLKRSDLAMYQAKTAGRDICQFYSPESESRVSRKLDMESGLRRALKRGEFEVHYQPQTSLADGSPTSVEALLRWNSPSWAGSRPRSSSRSPRRPGFIHSIGAWVLETAMIQARAWQDIGLRPMRMCVNVSAKQLNQNLVDTVAARSRQDRPPVSLARARDHRGRHGRKDAVTGARSTTCAPWGSGSPSTTSAPATRRSNTQSASPCEP